MTLKKFLTPTDYQAAQQVAAQKMSLSDHLFDQLFPYYTDEMPYGTQKARTGDPYQWITEQLKKDL